MRALVVLVLLAVAAAQESEQSAYDPLTNALPSMRDETEPDGSNPSLQGAGVPGALHWGHQRATTQTMQLYHGRGSANVLQGVLNHVDTSRFNAASRFGGGLYLGDSPSTVAAEFAHYDSKASHVAQYKARLKNSQVLDLTNPKVAARVGYTGDKNMRSRAIGRWAKQNGYKAIKFPSARAASGVNIVMVDGFDALKARNAFQMNNAAGTSTTRVNNQFNLNRPIDRLRQGARNAAQLPGQLVNAARDRLASQSVHLYHGTTNSGAARGVVGGIDPKFFNAQSRFGGGFYTAPDLSTVHAELSHYNAKPSNMIEYKTRIPNRKVLDLTNPEVAAKLKYTGDKGWRSRAIGRWAKQNGYSAIKFPSARNGGAPTFSIIDDFDKLKIKNVHALDDAGKMTKVNADFGQSRVQRAQRAASKAGTSVVKASSAGARGVLQGAKVAGKALGVAAVVATAGHSIIETRKDLNKFDDALLAGHLDKRALTDAILGLSTDLVLGKNTTRQIFEAVGKCRAEKNCGQKVREGLEKAGSAVATHTKKCVGDLAQCGRNIVTGTKNLASAIGTAASDWWQGTKDHHKARQEKAAQREADCESGKLEGDICSWWGRQRLRTKTVWNSVFGS